MQNVIALSIIKVNYSIDILILQTLLHKPHQREKDKKNIITPPPPSEAPHLYNMK